MTRATIMAGVLIATLSCAPPEGEEESLGAELCEHMADGPSIETAAGEALADAPDVSAPHTRFDLSFTAGRTVAFAAAADGVLNIALSDPAGLELIQGEALVVDALTPECAEVAAHVAAEVGLGTVELRFADDAPELSVVLELE